jgi:cell division septation protein DedD
MFALLFDRKSGLLTLLALGAIGMMLFAAGLVMGARLSWDQLASHLPHVAQTAPIVLPAAIPASDTAPAGSAWARPRTRTSSETAEPAAFPRREAASPPPGWVPLTDGAPWPGGEVEGGAHSSETAETPEAAETVKMAETSDSPAAAGDAASHYFVQAGTFPDEAGAEEMRTNLLARCHGKRYQPFLETVWDRYGRRLVAVRIGPLPDEAAALEVSNGLNGSLVGWSSGHRTL